MNTAKTIIASLLFLSYSAVLNAQNSVPKYEIGFQLGTALYLGDLTPTFTSAYKTPGFILGFHGARNINRFFALRGDLSLASIHGDDAKNQTAAYRTARALSFKTSMAELTLNLVWNVAGNDRLFTPYLMAGLGYSLINVQRDYSNFSYAYFLSQPNVSEGLATDLSHKLPRFIPVMPLGGGIRYSISENLSINAETVYRVTQTDYLDGYSQVANHKKNDSYFTHTIGIHYSFGGPGITSCPRL